jgi:hypothetical protein
MKIYNLLFYYVYELALRSKSNRDMPLFITITIITLCFMFNVFSISLILEGLGVIENVFPKESKFIGSLGFLGFVSVYYLYKKRYKTIYERFKAERKTPPSNLMAICVVCLYYLVSVVLLFLAGFFKNKDWIFSSL